MFRISTLAFGLMLGTFTPNLALAHEYKLGSITIGHPWTRATPPGASTGGAYLKLSNTGTVADRLTGGSVELAAKFEIHEMSVTNGVMTMQAVPKGLEIPPSGEVILKPGSFHVMFIGLKAPIKVGTPVKGTLVFEKAGMIEVEFKVEPIGSIAPAEHEHKTP